MKNKIDLEGARIQNTINLQVFRLFNRNFPSVLHKW